MQPVALKSGSTNFDAELLVNYSKKKARRVLNAPVS
jgi:hypothetical protein